MIEASGLAHAYAGVPSLHGVSLTVPEGALTALLGPSGSGKTTLLRLFAGLLAPRTGTVRLHGRDVTQTPVEARGAALLFQDALLFPTMDVAANVGFGLRLRRRARAEIAAEVAAMLARVGLEGFGGRRPQALSGGQAARVALARALVTRPRVLLLDEPFASLDAHLRADMRGLVRAVQREARITTLLVTHDQAEAVAMADRIALMDRGRIVQEGVPQDFFRRPATRFAAGFFGGVNFLEGSVAAGTFRGALGAMPATGAEGPATLTIRPEAIVVGEGPYMGRVTSRAWHGTHVDLTLVAGGVTLIARVPPEREVGETVSFALPALWRLPQA